MTHRILCTQFSITLFSIFYSRPNVTWVMFTIFDLVTWVMFTIFECGLGHSSQYLTAFYAYSGPGLLLTRQASK